MKLYLSGPMTGIVDYNFPAFMEEARRLRSLGYEVVNPAEVNAPGTRREDCLRNDIRHLIDCDGIALMRGWPYSKGAQLEQHVASHLGMEFFYCEDITTPLEQA
jgi:hypothetical protein